jgi:hypothetical protein
LIGGIFIFAVDRVFKKRLSAGASIFNDRAYYSVSVRHFTGNLKNVYLVFDRVKTDNGYCNIF